MLFPAPTTSSPPRVVITGAGIITALGLGWRANADGFREGRVAVRPVTLFDVSRHRTKVAAEVDLPRDLPETRLTAKNARRLDRAARLLVLAAHEAWTQAGWQRYDDFPCVIGTTSGGMSMGEVYYRQAFYQPNAHRRQATRAWQYMSQTQVRQMTEALGTRGPVSILVNACASGTNALGHAFEMLRWGRAERILAGGYDALSLLVYSGFDSLQALSQTTCRPFDARRDGLAVGEGAAVLTLETLASAERRNAPILGEILGYGHAIDLHHLTQPHPEGNAALNTMTAACASARITPAEVDYVNAHGTGTVLNDGAEAQAINRWAGARAATLPVSSTKASVGHLLGAAGSVEAVIGLMALREQWLPPEVTLQTPDPICAFPIVTRPTAARVDTVLSNSFGFGGANASIILRRWV
ncbi:MAG: beta-ketoacyl-[acyl-carrier-protein] synthase family protein [Verrucomicrobiota bacterium]